MREFIPPVFLQLESALLLPFLGMLIVTQLSRSGEALYSLPQARKTLHGLLFLFPILAITFGAFLYNTSPLLALELAAGFTLALLHPVNALCFFVNMLFLRPWDILPDNPLLAALPRLLALTCLFAWLLHPWRHGKPGRVATQALLLLGSFSIWLFLSTFVTPNVSETQAAWFDTFFKAVIVFIMCSYFIENRRSIAEFKYTILISIFTMATLGLYQYFTSAAAVSSSNRLSALSMLDPNDLAAISVIAVPLALTLVFSSHKGLSQRLMGLLFVGVCLLAIWYAQSRGALLAVVAQMLAFVILKTFARQRMLTLIAVGALVIGYLGLVGTMKRSQDDLQESSDSRITYWKAATKMALRNPLLGVGFDQYPEKYEAYSSSIKYEWGKRTAHSSWFLAFAESGLLGGCLFVAFFLTVLRAAWKNRRENPDQLYAMGGYGIAMSFLSHTYLLFPYLLYGLVLASDSVKEHLAHEA